MALKFKKFRNEETGETRFTPAGRYGNFMNSIHKLVQYVRYNFVKPYVAHITLTVAENVSEIDYKHVHRVMQFIAQRLKRAESEFEYIKAKERQERGAIHFYILCVYSKPYVFPGSNEIVKSWGLGFVKVTAPKFRNMKVKKIANYIGKYIGKGYEFEYLEERKSFSASQIKQIYKLNNRKASTRFI